MYSDEEFLAAILESPDDDMPRLIYADWLEEQGESEHAEFIRNQIELAAGTASASRQQYLSTRESELLKRYAAEWLPSAVRPYQELLSWSRGFPVQAELARVNTMRGTVVWALAKLPTLTHLTFTNGSADREWQHYLKRFPNLKSLVFRSTVIDPDVIRAVAQLEDLQALEISRETTLTSRTLAQLSRLTALMDLTLHDTNLNDQGLKEFGKIGGLKKLNVTSSQEARGYGLWGFSETNQIETLRLDYTPLSDEAFRHFPMFKQLRELSFVGCGIQDLELGWLRHSNKLEQMNLSGNLITGAGLRSLIHLNRLEDLNLSQTHLDGQYLHQLTMLPRLKTLDLSRTPLTDEYTYHLTGIENLEWLSLGGTRITSVSLRSLLQLHQLKQLILPHRGFTTAEVRKLEQELPRCKVTKR